MSLGAWLYFDWAGGVVATSSGVAPLVSVSQDKSLITVRNVLSVTSIRL